MVFIAGSRGPKLDEAGRDVCRLRVGNFCHSSTTSPVPGMTACVYDRHDNNLRSLAAKVDPKRKALHQRTTHIAAGDRISQRLFGYESERRERLGEEVMPQAGALILVPLSSFHQIPIRLFPESDGAIHSFFLISAITSSARRPGLPSAS
jgi:hypothetical protein